MIWVRRGAGRLTLFVLCYLLFVLPLRPLGVEGGGG